MQLKKCSTCGEDNPLTDYLDLKNQCSKCRSKHRKAKDALQKKKIVENQKSDNPDVKKCSDCQKDYIEYAVGNGRCRDCLNKRRRKNAAKKRVPEPEPSDPNNMICRECKVERPKTAFRKNRRKCKDCGRAHNRAYRRNEHGNQKAKTWASENKEQMTKLQAEWHQKNKDKINKKYVERYHSDINFKMKQCIKRRILGAMKSKGNKKKGKTVKYLGTSIPDFVKWFSYCFEFIDEKMSFDNHGKYWHIEHVVPINKFDLCFDENDDPEKCNDAVKLCFSWFNLMPLCGTENISKHDKIDKMQIRLHVRNLKDFLKQEGTDNLEVCEKYYKLCATYLDAGTP